MARDRGAGRLTASIAGIRCRKPEGAFYVFPNLGGACERLGILDEWKALPAAERAATSPSAMLQMFLLFRYGVATRDRNSFGAIGAEGQHFLRLSIAANLERLREGVRPIAMPVEDREASGRSWRRSVRGSER